MSHGCSSCSANAAAPRGRRKRLARKAIAQYNRRYEQLNEAYIDVRREEGRLDRAFRENP